MRRTFLAAGHFTRFRNLVGPRGYSILRPLPDIHYMSAKFTGVLLQTGGANTETLRSTGDVTLRCSPM